MKDVSRRAALKLLGAAAATGTISTTTGATNQPKKGNVRKMGHSLLSDPLGGYTEESIRSDGQYAVVGSFFGEGGSFLVDISNPRNPTEVHRLPSSTAVRNADVKFDHRDGLYYRSQEPNNGDHDAEFSGVEVIDYGFDTGTPEDPELVGEFVDGDRSAGPTHNLVAHPNEPLVYTVNEHGEDPAGLDIWDVSDPTDPTFQGTAGPEGALHDIVIDPDRELAHLAYIGGALDGYVILDTSDPWNPTEIGRFNYVGLPSYEDVGIEALREGTPGYQNCHYANFDPERGIAIVGDEIAFGVPGGKHVFDIGWGDGSPQDPQHIGFTLSPNAEVMDEGDEVFDWTGHNFDVIPKGDTTLLVSGDYHEGAVVYDISDPTNPTATDQYRTDDKADEANGPQFGGLIGNAPMAWGVDYADERDFTVVSDMVTGIYVFKFTPDAAATRGDR